MDLKVYTKETIRQPDGRESEDYFVPSIIDIYPLLEGEEENLAGSEIVEGNEETEQLCSLSTIWQRGLDPVDEEVGIRWSQALLGELNVVQLMQDIIDAVAQITPSVNVVFETMTDSNGNELLTYKLEAKA